LSVDLDLSNCSINSPTLLLLSIFDLTAISVFKDDCRSNTRTGCNFGSRSNSLQTDRDRCGLFTIQDIGGG
jgi:hypothetical protein